MNVTDSTKIIDLMIVLNRAAYTPPEVPCTKIKKNTSKATFTSSCWYGAQQAFGSWYPNEKTKKKITPTIEAALQLAKVNKHTNFMLKRKEKFFSVNCCIFHLD